MSVDLPAKILAQNGLDMCILPRNDGKIESGPIQFAKGDFHQPKSGVLAKMAEKRNECTTMYNKHVVSM
jgi:hypothetical protein